MIPVKSPSRNFTLLADALSNTEGNINGSLLKGECLSSSDWAYFNLEENKSMNYLFLHRFFFNWVFLMIN